MVWDLPTDDHRTEHGNPARVYHFTGVAIADRDIDPQRDQYGKDGIDLPTDDHRTKDRNPAGVYHFTGVAIVNRDVDPQGDQYGNEGLDLTY